MSQLQAGDKVRLRYFPDGTHSLYMTGYMVADIGKEAIIKGFYDTNIVRVLPVDDPTDMPWNWPLSAVEFVSRGAE